MWAREGHAPLDLRSLPGLERVEERVGRVGIRVGAAGPPLGDVLAVDRPHVAGQVAVRLADLGKEPVEESEAPAHQLRSGAGQLLVEDPERAGRVVTSDTLTQQRVALAQHSVVVRPRRLVARRDRHQQLVEVCAPLGRSPLDELEIVRSEDRHPSQLEQVPSPCERMVVEPHAVPPGRPQLRLEQLRPVVIDDLSPQHGQLGARSYQRGVGDSPERAPGDHPTGGFEQRRLPLRVGPHDNRHARPQMELGRLVAAEVGEPQPRQATHEIRTGIKR